MSCGALIASSAFVVCASYLDSQTVSHPALQFVAVSSDGYTYGAGLNGLHFLSKAVLDIFFYCLLEAYTALHFLNPFRQASWHLVNQDCSAEISQILLIMSDHS